MYGYLKLTDEERNQILESHSSYYGNKKSVNEQPTQQQKDALAAKTAAKTAQSVLNKFTQPAGSTQQAQGTTNFAPTHKATVEVDCQSKLVRISNYAGKLNAQGNGYIVDAFCNPKNRP